MMLVLDASVAAKLVLQEPDSEQAYEAIEAAGEFAAPDLILLEVASARLKAAAHRAFDPLQIEDVVQTLRAGCRPLVPTLDLVDEAVAIARKLRHPIYDCVYLALGRRLGVSVLTADAELVRACSRFHDWDGAAILLSRAPTAS